MVYDWENKEEVCYRLYIEEKKSLEEIMDYMKEEYKFTPRYATTTVLCRSLIDNRISHALSTSVMLINVLPLQ